MDYCVRNARKDAACNITSAENAMPNYAKNAERTSKQRKHKKRTKFL